MRDNWATFSALARSQVSASLLVFCFLVLVWGLSLLLHYPALWIFAWSPTPGFLIFEAIMSRGARGGSGIFNNPLTGRAMPKGHAILVIFTLIVIATVITDGFILLFTELYQQYPDSAPAVGLLANLIVTVWLGLWVHSRYFERGSQV